MMIRSTPAWNQPTIAPECCLDNSEGNMSLKRTTEDPRLTRTRQLIYEAFLALMSEQDFQKITVQDIAAHAGVNRATFYAHFEDKYALLDYAMQTMFDAALARKLPPTASFSHESLWQLTLVVCEFLGDFATHCGARHRSSGPNHPPIEAKVHQCVYQVIRGWLEALPPAQRPPDLTSEGVATVTSWAIFGTALEWSRGPRRKPTSEVAAQVLQLLTPGLAGLLAAPQAGPA
jgi:AcrR family transcriptional regulator